MRKGGSKVSDAGFTIVEVLIVLAVSGLLFVSAVVLIGGRQNKTMFMSATNDFRQQLQQIINQTQSGYYGGGSFGCTGSASLGPQISQVPNNDGSCIFVGNILKFTNGSGQFTVTPVVGNRLAANAQEATSIEQAVATPVPESTPGAVQTHTLGYGLTVTGATPLNLGIFSSLASYDSSCSASSACIDSGSQVFKLYDASGLSIVDSYPSLFSNPMYSSLAGLVVRSVTSAVVCVNSGTTSQSAQFTISGDGVTSQIYGGPGC